MSGNEQEHTNDASPLESQVDAQAAADGQEDASAAIASGQAEPVEQSDQAAEEPTERLARLREEQTKLEVRLEVLQENGFSGDRVQAKLAEIANEITAAEEAASEAFEAWKAEAKSLIYAADPERADLPVYLLTGEEVKDLIQDPSADAFTSENLCLELRPAIGERWKGYGFCAVFNGGAFTSRRRFLATALHEYGHLLDCEIARAHSCALLAGLRVQKAAAGPLREEPRLFAKRTTAEILECHGPTFFALCCHVAYRLRGTWPGDTQDLFDGTAGRLGLSPAAKYEEAMGDELERRRGESLFAVATAPLPLPFLTLWNEDRRRADAAKDDGTTAAGDVQPGGHFPGNARTPLEAYCARIAELHALVEQKAIDHLALGRSVAAADAELRRAQIAALTMESSR